MPLAALKVCASCGEELPVERFYAVKNSCKSCIKVKSQAWRNGNPERRRESDALYKIRTRERRNAQYRARIANDPAFALKNNIKTTLFKAMVERGAKKIQHAEAILGCTWPAFVAHMEKQFVEGMIWANRGAWHIDHIIPLATALTSEDVLRLNHFTNLRPLWGEENMAKGAKVLTLL